MQLDPTHNEPLEDFEPLDYEETPEDDTDE